MVGQIKLIIHRRLTLAITFGLLALRVHFIVFFIAALMPVGDVGSGGHYSCLTGACVAVLGR